MAHRTGDGFFKIDNPTDEATRERYREALIEVLVIFENAIKLIVKAEDTTGLRSIESEVFLILAKAENTLRDGPGKDRPGKAG